MKDNEVQPATTEPLAATYFQEAIGRLHHVEVIAASGGKGREHRLYLLGL